MIRKARPIESDLFYASSLGTLGDTLTNDLRSRHIATLSRSAQLLANFWLYR